MRIMRMILALLCVVRLAGATPIEQYDSSGGKDYAPAFDAAQIACAGRPCRIDLSVGPYPISRPIDVCAPLEIRGIGVPHEFAASRITTVRTTAIRTWHVGQCPRADLPQGRGHLVIDTLIVENTRVLRTGEVWAGAPAFFGLEIRTRVDVSKFATTGFIQGVRLACDKSQGSNCNASTFTDVDTVQNEHAGVFVQGGDANAMTFTRLRSDNACRNAEIWDALVLPACTKYAAREPCLSPRSRCAGIFDASFIGNTYIGPVTAADYGHAGMVFLGDGNASTVIGAYIEDGDQPGSSADAQVTIIGGHNAFGGGAGQLHGTKSPGFEINSGGVVFKLGMPANQTGIIWSVGNAATSLPWRFKLDALTGDLKLDVGNLAPLRGYTPYKVAP